MRTEIFELGVEFASTCIYLWSFFLLNQTWLLSVYPGVVLQWIKVLGYPSCTLSTAHVYVHMGRSDLRVNQRMIKGKCKAVRFTERAQICQHMPHYWGNNFAFALQVDSK